MFTSKLRQTVTLTAVLACVAAAAAQPQLVARVDGQEVASFSELNFGALNLGQSEQIVVTLRNEGTEDLVFAETPPIQLSGAFADQFNMIQPALEVGGKLSPNSSTAFAVRFEPTIEFAGVNANVFIFTNQSAAPFRLQVRGSGTQPNLDVAADGVTLASEDEFDFGDVELGQASEATFEIRNTGTGLMTLTETPNISGGLGALVMEIVEVPDMQIAAGESTTMTVRFNPNEARIFASNLFIRSDAPNGDLFRLNLLGNAVEVEVEEEEDAEEQEQDEEIEDEQDEDQDEQDGDDQEDDQQQQDQDPNDLGDLDDDQANDPNDAYNVDPNEPTEFDAEDPNDGNVDEDELEEIEIDIDDELITPLTCGFGAGFASLASMASLGAARRRRRRWIC